MAEPGSLSIVVPTYREADNLPRLAEAIDAAIGAQLEYELLIVDDNSPDDTRAVCARLGELYPLRLIVPTGRPRDLSISVIDGIRDAKHQRILVMDADLSHPPEQIMRMVSVLEGDPKAFIIGSRYVEGGVVDPDWGLWRSLNSNVATMLARPLTNCSDPMSGFFLFQKDRIGDLDSLNPIGYKIGLELMVRGNFSEVVEIPISFSDREIGESKMNLGQQVRYLRYLRRLYLYKFGSVAEFVHFGVIGSSGFVVDILIYYLLQLVGVPHLLARAISFWPAVSWNWALNRRTTFGHRERRPKARQWSEFVATSLVGFCLNWGIYLLLTRFSPFFDEYRFLALITGVICASMVNFLLASMFVYSEKRTSTAETD